MTPEGFLLCRDVRLGRTGEMVYGPTQTPIPAGSDGVAHIERTADVLFHPDTLASFVGKPVTIKHPEAAVTVDNWKDHAAGHILNARRGEAPFSDFMVGDVLVTSKDAIDLANAGCEISSGYDAAYEQTAPGRGKQTRIVGNHLAFLPDGIKGRCGPMCYVGDQSMDIGDSKMSEKSGAGVDLLKKLFGAKDETAVQAALDQAAAAELTATTDAQIAKLSADVAALTTVVTKLVPVVDEKAAKDDKKDDDEDDKDEKKKTADAAAVTELHTRTKGAAEILAPGTTVPTLDAANLTATRDQICACQRRAIEKAYETPTGKTAVESLLPGGPAKITADNLEATFFGASALMAALNNNVLAAMAMTAPAVDAYQSQTAKAAEADKRSVDRWAYVNAPKVTI